MALEESRYDQRVLDDLEAVRNLVTEDPDIHFLLGRLYQSLGQNDRAVAEYTRGAQASPAEDRCLVNRGNIRFVDGDFGSAQEDFQEALRRNSRNIAARYNLSLVYAETFRTVEAASTLQEVRALDSRKVQRFHDNPTLVKVVSQDFSPAEARAKIEALRGDARSHRILGHFRGEDPARALRVPLAAGVFLAIGGAFAVDPWRKRGGGYSSSCQKCGRTFCRLCKPPGQSALLCSQCVHVYLKKDGVAIETALQKVEEVKRRRSFEDRRRVGLNLLLPGSAAFRDSRVLAGAGSMAVFLVGLLAMFARDTLAVSPRPPAISALPGTVFWGSSPSPAG